MSTIPGFTIHPTKGLVPAPNGPLTFAAKKGTLPPQFAKKKKGGTAASRKSAGTNSLPGMGKKKK